MRSGSPGRFILPLVLLPGVVVAAGVSSGPAMLQDLREEASKGRDLSAAQAAMLERQLAEAPQSLGARAQLLGYYFRNRRANPARHTEHVLWFIRNAPESDVLDSSPGRITPMFDPDGYLEAKRAWQRLVGAEPDNVTILRHAATFHRASEAAVAARLLRQAEGVEPSNPEWARDLARLHWREVRRFPGGRDPVAAARALVDFERAHDLSDAAGRRGLLPDLAMAAFAAEDHEKAREYGAAMLELESSPLRTGDLIHYGNLILGHVALEETDLERARTHLLAAGRMRRSPVERLGAPDMTLAKALLERGESEIVLAYFELCFDFWQEGHEQLKDWIVLVEAGRIPDFRQHLMF